MRLPGRKTDMKDCQWHATLHVNGLLNPGFVPPAHIRRLQDYLRVRTDHITMAGSHEQHMQKALDRMHVSIAGGPRTRTQENLSKRSHKPSGSMSGGS
jgi:transposase